MANPHSNSQENKNDPIRRTPKPLTWVTSSAMLRPSTSVWGLTDTALHTTEKETFPRWLFFKFRDNGLTRNCWLTRLPVRTLELQKLVDGLIREAIDLWGAEGETQHRTQQPQIRTFFLFVFWIFPGLLLEEKMINYRPSVSGLIIGPCSIKNNEINKNKSNKLI